MSDVNLAEYTAFKVGGPAENFALCHDSADQLEALKCTLPGTKLWVLGYGSNSLISDQGLPGMVLCLRGGKVTVEGNKIIADAGAWWDDVVTTAIDNNLWGIELLSEVPGSVGAAAYINITAYGQSFGNNVDWIEVWDRKLQSVRQLEATELNWGYKQSIFQLPENAHLIITRVCFKLSTERRDELTYQKAIEVAEVLKLNVNDLKSRRKIIIESRKRAGSIWHPDDVLSHRTVGSFFRNPTVSQDKADAIMSFDETGETLTAIRKMNQVHGGDACRVSAAHVMLAAGFKRGQTWGNVKLNDQNLLKIEALPGATAQEIYDTAKSIQNICLEKLEVKLEPEARILGHFN